MTDSADKVVCSNCRKQLGITLHDEMDGFVCDSCYEQEWVGDMHEVPSNKRWSTLAEINKASEETLVLMYGVVMTMAEEQDRKKRVKLAKKYHVLEHLRKDSLRMKV